MMSEDVTYPYSVCVQEVYGSSLLALLRRVLEAVEEIGSDRINHITIDDDFDAALIYYDAEEWDGRPAFKPEPAPAA